MIVVLSFVCALLIVPTRMKQILSLCHLTRVLYTYFMHLTCSTIILKKNQDQNIFHQFNQNHTMV